jgi:hypothetical protein
MQPKSPFLVFQNFLSPLMCENIVDALNVTTPDTDKQGHPIPSYRHNKKYEKEILVRCQDLFELFEDHYNVEYRGFERPTFEWYIEGVKDDWRCGNSEYLRDKWVRTRDRDLTGIIFLSEYQNHVPFDVDFEVCGGKLEFAQHDFGFNPERGTMIIFPAGPHFLHRTGSIEAGDLFQVRFHIATMEPFLYQPRDFPGDFRTWLKPYMR